MSRKFVNTLQDGETVEETYLLTDKQLRANRNAQLYLLATLRDKTAAISGLMWNVTEEAVAHIEIGDFVSVKGKVQLFQGNLQMILTKVGKVSAEGMDPEEFEPQPTQDVEGLQAKLRELLLSIEDEPIRMLMEAFLVDESIMDRLGMAAAGVKAHHAYPGGLLEHIVNMLEVARRIDDLYPTVDLSLLSAGIFLHDLGKIRELDPENPSIYTDEGQLLGHMMIGVEMLSEKIAQVAEMTGEPFPEETVLRIKHMILSHHGTYEFGSSKLPMTPEAIALHHLDNLDAKVAEFSSLIADDPNGDARWTPYMPRLDRKIYKGSRKAESTDS